MENGPKHWISVQWLHLTNLVNYFSFANTEASAQIELNMDDIFLLEGLSIFRAGKNASMETIHKAFRSHFGCSVSLCSLSWSRMIQLNVLEENIEPKHLLWTLLWLRHYLKLDIICTMCQCSTSTFIKWRDAVTNGLSEMDMVRKNSMQQASQCIFLIRMLM